MVHRFVTRAPQHVTADAIHAELPSVSFATIYSTLELLEDLGLVRRVSTLEGAAVYDSRVQPHGHAMCRRCGAIFDLDGDAPAPSRLPSGFTAESAQLQVVGLCADCAG
jgi:Fe2+ or Zn2+ uptake regulation protein